MVHLGDGDQEVLKSRERSFWKTRALAMKPRKLYRAARISGWTAIILGFGLLGFVASIAVSAGQITYEGTLPTSSRSAGPNEMVISAVTTISNPGIYSLQGFRVNLHLLTSNGTLVAYGSSNTTVLGAHSTSQVPIEVLADLSSPAAGLLITTNATLVVQAWVNATYAGLFPVALQLHEDYPWGAPFVQPQYAFGVATQEANGSVSLPISMSYQNWFPVPEYGTFDLGVLSVNGSNCGGGKISTPFPVAQGQAFSGSTDLTLRSGCDFHGGKLQVHYSGLLLSLELPSVVVP